MADQESLLSPSNVLLYGRILTDLKLENPTGKEPQGLGANQFLEKQLLAEDPGLARIYGFSYEGHYYDLTSPAIFLVHGKGADPEGPPPADPRVSRAPTGVDLTGVAGRTGSFSEDIRVWSYDKGDFSLRMDIETGPFEEILLEAELVAEEMQGYYSGQRVRASGQRVRASGQRVRGPGSGGNLGD